jgi:CheY-like chemotaxis protein
LAPNGQEAARETNNQEHTLIITDIEMPLISEIEAIKTLQSQGYTKPIIGFSAKCLKEDIEDYIAIG